jgi:hypothetical protein
MSMSLSADPPFPASMASMAEGALRTRISILEAALACVQRECNTAFDAPEVAFATLCRIHSVARQTMPPPRRHEHDAE